MAEDGTGGRWSCAISTATCGQREGGQFELTAHPNWQSGPGLSTNTFRSAASPTAHKTRSMREDSIAGPLVRSGCVRLVGEAAQPRIESVSPAARFRVFGAHGRRRGIVEPGLGCRWHKPSAMLAPACPGGAESARPQHPRCSSCTLSCEPMRLIYAERC